MKVTFEHISSHQSSREGARPHLAALHTEEGDLSLEAMAALTESEEASWNYASDAKGRIGRYVQDENKAWTQCNYNPVCLSLEQAGYAEWDRSKWFSRHDQLHAAAEFLVHCHVHWGIPIRKGKVENGGVVRDGVVQHKDLGLIGCGHTDCGDGYPQDYIEVLARYFIAHKLHPTAPHTERLRREVNNIRQHHKVDLIPAPKGSK